MILNSHYIAIKSLSRLLSSKNSKHKRKEYFCINCLQGFQQEISRDKHRIDNESVKVEMPHKKPIVEFCDGQYQFKVPFAMYADFESLFRNPAKIRVDLGQLQQIIIFPPVGVFIASLLTESFKIL